MRSLCVVIATALSLWRVAADQPPIVSAHDAGVRYESATYECQAGHRVEKRSATLDSGTTRYTFGYSGCADPSHGDSRPSAEGNLGMPAPTAANWYWGGFLRVLINDVDAVSYRVEDWRVIETGARGTVQIVFAHPDAELGVRLMMLPGANHVLADFRWRPRPGATIKSVAVELRCYPSFFTAARHRNGDRHCGTPRTDAPQDQTLQLVPGADTYLYYYDTVFDPAKGEGDGPCAALVAPDGLTGGRVVVGSYAVITTLDYRPDAGAARLGFYDFSGSTNAAADEYLKTHGAEDLGELVALDSRPLTVRDLNVEKLREEAGRLLTDAGEDGQPYQDRVNDLLARATALKAEVDAGDWRAEADLGAEIEASADLFWKLRAFAVLNNPGG